MRSGPQARKLIQKWEGIADGDPTTVNLDPYLCPAGYWTIGWGHVVRDPNGKMLKGAWNKQAAKMMYPIGITYEEAEILLVGDLIGTENGVTRFITGANHHQFGAMVALAFNIGVGAFGKSSVCRNHNAGRFEAAADSFLLYNKIRVDGQLVVSKGLTSRRKDERAFYLSAD